LWADAVLGCDGANSTVRQAIGAAWQDLRFEERWLVLDVRTSLPVRCWEGVDQVCDPGRAATVLRAARVADAILRGWRPQGWEGPA